jgi:hypothetical protein
MKFVNLKSFLLCGVILVLASLEIAVAQKTAIRIDGMSARQLRALNLPNPNDWDNVSTGLNVVGIGSAVWLTGWDITGDSTYKPASAYTWAMTSRPTGSTATLSSTTAQRVFFQPDVAGSYAIRLTIGTKDTTITIKAAAYTGTNRNNVSGAPMNCASCHESSARPDIYTRWKNSAHAKVFENRMNGIKAANWGESCFKCHTTGYNNSSLAANSGGFKQVATQVGFVASQWLPWRAGKYDSLLTTDKKMLSLVAGVGCESCHGPKDPTHFSAGTQPQTMSSEVCARCHDAPPRYNQYAQWENTKHSGKVASPANQRGFTGTAVVTAYNLNDCVRCHDGAAFVNFTQGKPFDNRAASGYSRLARTPITCQTCHEPHNGGLRSAPAASDTLTNGFSYRGIDFGKGKVCVDCHKYRRYGDDQVLRNMSTTWGPHYAGVADVFLGQSAARVTGNISAHKLVQNTCVGCHMQPTPDTTSVARDKIGMHTWKMRYVAPDNRKYDNVAVCQPCHGPINTFDDIIAFMDYDGNGRKEAFTTEFNNLMERLGKALPPFGVKKVATTDINRTAIATHPDSVRLKIAFWNYLYLKYDGSSGMHNPTHAINVLQQSLLLLGYSLTGAELVADAPRSFELEQNYPNPFNPSTRISFSLPKESPVSLQVFDMMGRVVATLVDEVLPPGRHTVVWNGRASDGRQMASGIYFYRLKADGYIATRKMMLLK